MTTKARHLMAEVVIAEDNRVYIDAHLTMGSYTPAELKRYIKRFEKAITKAQALQKKAKKVSK